jgi:glycosyltransferase involved in cell wall biosynthesis
MHQPLHVDPASGAVPGRRRVDLVFPALPPALDGIGDHTARLAEALARDCDVRVLTAQEGALPIRGATVERAFTRSRRGALALPAAVAARRPDWLLLQFEQFSYGRWGLNPLLPLALRVIRRRSPATRLALVAHEDFVPVTSWKFAIMTTWQRAQFWALGRLSDLVLCSVAEWAVRYERWFPGAEVRHLPVGSNVRPIGAGRREARLALGVPVDAFVLGVFGNVRAQRSLGAVRAAAEALRQRGAPLAVLYAGPQSAAVRAGLPGVRLIDAGPVSEADASRCFAAMDVYVAPFFEGVTARRGSFMAALAHGVPSVTTGGPLTDPLLRRAHGRAFLLAEAGDTDAFVRQTLRLHDDAALQKRLRRGALDLYARHFAWDVLAASVQDAFAAVENRAPAGAPAPLAVAAP